MVTLREIRKRLISKKFEKKIKAKAAPLLIVLLIKFLSLTLRITEHNPENVRQIWGKRGV